MGRASRLARPKADARSTKLESRTSMHSKISWDPSPDGCQLCEPKIEPTVGVNFFKLLKFRLCVFIKLIET